MRTTVELPDDLVKRAKHYYKAKTMKETLIRSLEESLRKASIEWLISRQGKGDINVNLDIARHGRNY